MELNPLANTVSSGQKTKSFWRQPEGLVGLGVLAVLAYAGSKFLTGFLNFVYNLLETTLGIAILAIVLATLYYVFIVDRTLPRLAGWAYKSMMRKITGWFIELDPIGILRNIEKKLRGNLNKLAENIQALSGVIGSTKKAVTQNEHQIKKDLEAGAIAKREQKTGPAIVRARNAERLQRSNERLNALVVKGEVLRRILTKYHDTSELLIQDINGEISVREIERKQILQSHSAMRSAMNIIQGNPDDKMLFDQTMQFLADDYGSKLGEIEHMMRMSSKLIDSVNLDQQVYDERAFKMLEEWEKKGDSILLGQDKQALLNQTYRELGLATPEKQKQFLPSGDYDTLFEN